MRTVSGRPAKLVPVRRLAPVLDFLSILVFVALGRREHELGYDLASALRTLWPFLVGWFAVALLTKLYLTPSWGRWLITWLGGIVVALGLRATLGGHDFVLSFAIVATFATGAFTGGWRIVVAFVQRRRATVVN